MAGLFRPRVPYLHIPGPARAEDAREARFWPCGPAGSARRAALWDASRGPVCRMRVVTSEGQSYGGADAVVYLTQQIWWAWPVYALSRLPGIRRALRCGYRWFAAHRLCASNACSTSPKSRAAS